MVGFLEKGVGELWMLTVGTTARGIRTISSVSWPRGCLSGFVNFGGFSGHVSLGRLG